MFSKIIKSLLLLTLIVFTNCSKDDDDNNNSTPGVVTGNDSAPAWTVENNKVKLTAAPSWVTVADELDISSSMTMTCKIVNSKGSVKVADGDMLAAFINDKCVGVATASDVTPNGKRFFLYINDFIEPAGINDGITLLYYSSTQKTTTRWIMNSGFTKDAILGTVLDPVELNVDDADDYDSVACLFMGLPSVITDNISSDDEMALFVGGVCRVIKGDELALSNKSQMIEEIIEIYGDEMDFSGIIPDDVMSGVTYLISFVPVNYGENEVVVKYYSSKLSRIFTFDPLKITPESISVYQKDEVKYK